MIGQLLMSANGTPQAVSTVDLLDPFGDGSGIALYKFDGDATEESGIYNGTASDVTYDVGKFGQCAVFNGSSSYVHPSKVASIATDISFSLWVKLTSTPSGNLTASLFEVNIRHINSTTIIGGLCCVFSSNGKLALYGKTYNGSTYAYSIYNTTLPIGQYAHVICIFSKTLGRSLYVDGVLQIPTVVIGPNDVEVLDFSKFYIGKNVNTNPTYTGTSINGSIDQFRIFNRALTQEEVTALYNENVETYVPYIPPQGFFNDGSEVAHYKFDGDVLDSVNSYDGTASNLTYGTGKFGQCAVFNGSTSRVITTTRVNTGNNISVSCWVMFNDFGDGWIINQRSNVSSGSEWQIVVYQGQLAPAVINSSNIFIASTSFPVSSLSLGVWYNLSFTYDGSKITFYINGDISSSAIGAGTVSNGASFLAFGMAGFDLTNSALAFNGSIDNSRIFNRALTATEVTALYNEGQ